MNKYKLKTAITVLCLCSVLLFSGCQLAFEEVAIPDTDTHIDGVFVTA